MSLSSINNLIWNSFILHSTTISKRPSFREKEKTWKRPDNDERPTGKKNTTIEWDDGEKGNSNLILNGIPLKHEIILKYVIKYKKVFYRSQ